MPRFEPLDLSALNAPVAQPQGMPAEQPQSPGFWSKAIAVGLVVLAIMWFFRGGDISPGPNPIDADGLHVLVVEPADRSTVSKLQNEFINSVKIADWVDSKKGQFRRAPESASLKEAGEIWQEMRKLADGMNRVVVVKDNRPYRMPLPEGVEAGIKALEGIR
jgi:hypothetical protein